MEYPNQLSKQRQKSLLAATIPQLEEQWSQPKTVLPTAVTCALIHFLTGNSELKFPKQKK